MGFLTAVPFLARGSLVSLLLLVAAGLLFGPAGLRPEPRTAEGALSELKKLTASDAQFNDHWRWTPAAIL